MAPASPGRADKGSSRSSRAFRAPLQRARLAVGGQGRGEEKPKARQLSSCAQTQGATMSDPEIEELRDKVHCAVVLERTPPPWKLDRKESTKLSLKYRRGKGEILIVSHGGKGWWDPTSDDLQPEIWTVQNGNFLVISPAGRRENSREGVEIFGTADCADLEAG